MERLKKTHLYNLNKLKKYFYVIDISDLLDMEEYKKSLSTEIIHCAYDKNINKNIDFITVPYSLYKELWSASDVFHETVWNYDDDSITIKYISINMPLKTLNVLWNGVD